MHLPTVLYRNRNILVSPWLMSLVLLGAAAVSLGATVEEDRCRAAVTTALDTPRQQVSGTPRDEERRKQLLAELEGLVASNRRQGIDECRTWQEIMGRAARQ